MATRGKTDKVGTSTEDEEPAEEGNSKDFKSSKVEGKKSKKDAEEDAPVTCEDVIRRLRKDKYRI